MTETFVHIDRMRLHACHGVMPQERTVGNDYVVDIKVGYPWQRAMMSDDVADTLNYATLSAVIRKEMAVPSALLEHVAGRIVDAVGKTFPQASSIQLRLTKIAPPMSVDCHGAGVEIIHRYPTN